MSCLSLRKEQDNSMEQSKSGRMQSEILVCSEVSLLLPCLKGLQTLQSKNGHETETLNVFRPTNSDQSDDITCLALKDPKLILQIGITRKIILGEFLFHFYQIICCLWLADDVAYIFHPDTVLSQWSSTPSDAISDRAKSHSTAWS